MAAGQTHTMMEMGIGFLEKTMGSRRTTVTSLRKIMVEPSHMNIGLRFMRVTNQNQQAKSGVRSIKTEGQPGLGGVNDKQNLRICESSNYREFYRSIWEV